MDFFGEHFIHRIAIYPLDTVIRYLNNWGQNAQVRGEKDRRAKLRTLCERRWLSRADALCTFCAAFQVVVQPLEILYQDEGATFALSRRLIIALYATEHVLSNTLALSTMLQ